ncbi:MAG: hypothetical protein WDO15_06395 [Bacteroidota bacterium]
MDEYLNKLEAALAIAISENLRNLETLKLSRGPVVLIDKVNKVEPIVKSEIITPQAPFRQ